MEDLLASLKFLCHFSFVPCEHNTASNPLSNPTPKLPQVLHKAMKGLGTDDSVLVRIVVSRTEIDLQYIKAEYMKKYRKPLGDAIHSETSGHYRTFLLSLVGPNH